MFSFKSWVRRLRTSASPSRKPRPRGAEHNRAQLALTHLEDRTVPSHFRGAAMVPSIDANSVLTVETTSFWRKGTSAAPNLVVRNAATNTAPSFLSQTFSLDTTDSRFDKRVDVQRYNLVGGPQGNYTVTWDSCCRIAGIKNASESSWTMNSSVVWSGTATKPIGFNFSSVQPEVVRGSNYSGNLSAVAGAGLTLSYDQALNQTFNNGILSQPPGFTINSSTGALSIPAASTANYLDNTSSLGVGGDYAFSGNIFARDTSGNLVGQVEFDWLFDAVNVSSVNLAPTVDDATASANIGTTINHTFTGSDPEGQALTWSFAGLIGPGGATPAIAPTFDTNSRAFSWNTTGSVGGTWIVQVQATDPGGKTDLGSLTINLNTAPDLVAASDTGFSNTDDVTADNTPTFEGVAGANNTVQIYDGATLLGTTTANSLGQWSFTAGTMADGNHSITAQAGSNVSGALALQIDTQAPTIGFTRTPANASGWNNTDVIVTVNGTDGLSGIHAITGDTTLSGEGAGQSVSGTVTDKAGNVASSSVGGINIDKTKPTVAIVSGPASVTNSTTAAFTLSHDDDRSGVDRLEYSLDGGAWTALSGSSFTGLAQGSHTLAVRSVDRADNVSDVATHNWTVDQTTSVSVASASGTYGGTTTLQATLTWNGEGSALAGKTVAFAINGTAVGTAVTDNAGLAVLSNVSLAGIDAGSYAAGVVASFAGDAGYNGSNGAGSLTLAKATSTTVVTGGSFTYDGTTHSGGSAVVSGAGVVTGTAVLSYIGDQVNAGTYTVVATYAGDANHTGSSGTATIVITKANATISVNGGTYVYDGLAHPATGSVTGVGGISLGAPTFTYAFQDNDGAWVPTGNSGADAPVEPGYYRVTAAYSGNGNYNAATGQAFITIAFEVKSLTDLSKAFNAGRTIPIKIQLTDASGNNISSASIDLTAIRLQRRNADGSWTEVTLQDAGGSNPDNLFRYDATLGGYIFNLSTKGLTAGTYAFFWMAEGDPTEHELGFRLV